MREKVIRVCQECGKEDQLHYRADRKPCSSCCSCSQKGDKNNNWKGGLTELNWRHKSISKKCSECGKIFMTGKSYKVFCSKKCGTKQYNRLNHRKYKHILRARQFNALGFFELDEFYALVEKLNNYCPACNRYFDTNAFAVDHIVPLRHGGTNYISNIQPLCFSCNVKKGDKQAINYLALIPAATGALRGSGGLN